MARLLSIILLLLLASPVWAFPPLIAGKSAGGAAACTTPSQGSLFTEGFEGSSACYSGGTAACENLNKWTVVSGTPTFGYTLPGSWLTNPNCTHGLRTNVNEAEFILALDEGSARYDIKISFYLYLDASTAGTDTRIFSSGESSTENSSRFSYVAFWNNAGSIYIKAGGATESGWIRIYIDKLYKLTLNANRTTATNSFFKVEDCSSGTCSDMTGSPDTAFRAHGTYNSRYYFFGGLGAGAGEITDFVWDAIGIGAAD